MKIIKKKIIMIMYSLLAIWLNFRHLTAAKVNAPEQAKPASEVARLEKDLRNFFGGGGEVKKLGDDFRTSIKGEVFQSKVKQRQQRSEEKAKQAQQQQQQRRSGGGGGRSYYSPSTYSPRGVPSYPSYSPRSYGGGGYGGFGGGYGGGGYGGRSSGFDSTSTFPTSASSTPSSTAGSSLRSGLSELGKKDKDSKRAEEEKDKKGTVSHGGSSGETAKEEATVKNMRTEIQEKMQKLTTEVTEASNDALKAKAVDKIVAQWPKIKKSIETMNEASAKISKDTKEEKEAKGAKTKKTPQSLLKAYTSFYPKLLSLAPKFAEMDEQKPSTSTGTTAGAGAGLGIPATEANRTYIFKDCLRELNDAIDNKDFVERQTEAFGKKLEIWYNQMEKAKPKTAVDKYKDIAHKLDRIAREYVPVNLDPEKYPWIKRLKQQEEKEAKKAPTQAPVPAKVSTPAKAPVVVGGAPPPALPL